MGAKYFRIMTIEKILKAEKIFNNQRLKMKFENYFYVY